MVQDSVKFGLIARLDVLVEVLLKVTHLVRDEAKCMMQREPLRILGILVKVLPQAIQFSEDSFCFHINSVEVRSVDQ
jgi:hypothetical protein